MNVKAEATYILLFKALLTSLMIKSDTRNHMARKLPGSIA